VIFLSEINLPISYIEDMKELLKSEFDDFISTYNENPHKSISLNTKKTSVQKFLDIRSDCVYERVPWSVDSLYVNEGNISKNPLYHTGAYYIQEPSASSVVNFLDVNKGMKVLDMCASPGGKTFQISQRLSDDDILISNDANNSRMPQLLRNIEYHGLSNVMIINETQDKLAENFPSFFDRILLDVPCSGEGMFRKDSKLISSYEKSKSQLVSVQKDLLTKASKMLKRGGKLIYSTCTFNKRENELNIIEFLEENSDFEIINIEKNFNFTSFDELKESARLFPHKLRGEGHFLALLQKKGEEEELELPKNEAYISREKLPKAYLDFEEKSKNANEQKNATDKQSKEYAESLEKMRALSIAARIARGEEISRAQIDFLNFNYPEMLNDASVVNHKIQSAFKLLDESQSRKEAEEMLQKIDSKLLTMPYGSGEDTVFDHAMQIISKKS